MNNSLLIFTIDNHEKFIINIDHADDIIHCCYQSQVSLFFNTKKFIIGKSIVADFAQELKKKLTLALKYKLKLHRSIKKILAIIGIKN